VIGLLVYDVGVAMTIAAMQRRFCGVPDGASQVFASRDNARHVNHQTPFTTTMRSAAEEGHEDGRDLKCGPLEIIGGDGEDKCEDGSDAGAVGATASLVSPRGGPAVTAVAAADQRTAGNAAYMRRRLHGVREWCGAVVSYALLVPLIDLLFDSGEAAAATVHALLPQLLRPPPTHRDPPTRRRAGQARRAFGGGGARGAADHAYALCEGEDPGSCSRNGGTLIGAGSSDGSRDDSDGIDDRDDRNDTGGSDGRDGRDGSDGRGGGENKEACTRRQRISDDHRITQQEREEERQRGGQEGKSPRFLCCRSFDYSMGTLEPPPTSIVIFRAVRQFCAACAIAAVLLWLGTS